jgi:hypothetical protein
MKYEIESSTDPYARTPFHQIKHSILGWFGEKQDRDTGVFVLGGGDGGLGRVEALGCKEKRWYFSDKEETYV